jgi:hypothetical protein
VYVLKELWLVDDGPPVLLVRWLEVHRDAAVQDWVWSWKLLGKAYVAALSGAATPTPLASLQGGLYDRHGKARRFELRSGDAVRTDGPSTEDTLGGLLMAVIGAGKKLLVIDPDVQVLAFTCEGQAAALPAPKVFTLKAAAADADLPPCLREGHVDQGGRRYTLDVVSASVEPCQPMMLAAGYWPLRAIFCLGSLRRLVEVIRHALALADIDIECQLLVEGSSSFARDYFVNLCGSEGAINLATTKNAGQGWLGPAPPGQQRQPPSASAAAQNSLGFGGNFLCGEVAHQPIIVTGLCGHGRGGTGMLDELGRCLGIGAEVLELDTGWLTVGHVDEIVTFPAPGMAFLACPAAFRGLYGSSELPHLALNDAAQRKLAAVQDLLLGAGFAVIGVPVWFQPGPDGRLASMRGNPVNCLYVGGFAVHAISGLDDDRLDEDDDEAPEPFGPRTSVDLAVARIFEGLGLVSLFVDMRAQNDESGAGGNVHCATYTVHERP